MSFVSFGFLVFLAVGILVYYLIPKRFQWCWLLVMSYFFYLSAGVKMVGFILFTTASTFVGALLLERVNNTRTEVFQAQKGAMSSEEKKAYKARTKMQKRWIVVVIMVVNFGILTFLKYFNFTVDNINVLATNLFHTEAGLHRINILMPLGISFYTFQSMGYIIDIYQGKYEADKSFFKFALFVSWFPQILQGPIGRYNRLAHQFYEKHYFDLVQIQHGLQLMAWGFFKKLVIADRANVIVEEVFRYVHQYQGVTVIFGVLAFCMQEYADFSGGMDIVMGASECFGIKLDQNFRQPLFSVSISDFWHRWHITLGTWMKDYIFYPFSLSKAMKRFGKFTKKVFGNTVGRCLPICLANILIFFIVGVWHGAEWKFIVFGLYNGFLIAFSNLCEPLYPKMFQLTHINPNTKVWKCVRILRTFILVIISFYIERAIGVYAAYYMLRNSITGFHISTLIDGSLLKLGVDWQGMLILLAGCSGWFIISILKEKGICVRDAIDRRPLVIRWAIYGALILAIPIFGEVTATIGGFIYAQY